MQCVLACMVHISNRMRKENRKHVANCCSTKQLSHFTFHAWPIHRKTQWKGINFNCSDVYLCCRFLSTAKAKCCIILSIACSLFFVRMHAYEHMFLECDRYWIAGFRHACYIANTMHIWSESSNFPFISF